MIPAAWLIMFYEAAGFVCRTRGKGEDVSQYHLSPAHRITVILLLSSAFACTKKPVKVQSKAAADGGVVVFTGDGSQSATGSSGTYNPSAGYTQTDCDQPATLAGPRRLRILSQNEFRYTFRDLFNIEVSAVAQLGTGISKHLLFDNIGRDHPARLADVKAYLKVAEEASGLIDLERYAPCSQDKRSKLATAKSCLQSFVNEVGSRLWRRPLTQEEEDRLGVEFSEAFGQGGESAYQAGMRAVLTNMLFSPHFLYRSELGQPLEDGRYKLTDWEVASLLSYLLWRSVPDEPLRELASQGKLSDANVRRTEAERMIKDKKAERSIGDFANQWTRAYKVLSAPKDTTRFSYFTEEVRRLLSAEPVDFYKFMFLADAHEENHTFKELLQADFTIGGEKLAAYYKSTSASNRIERTEQKRRGLLGHAGLLAGNSYADSSSPVHRGVFVIENLLCRKFPDPPAVIVPAADENKSNRDRFAAHSEKPECALCHKDIDQIGFSFENFDATGKLLADAGGRIKTSGEFNLDGRLVQYPDSAALSEILSESKEAHTCHVTQWYRFAFGQKEELTGEACFIKHIATRFIEQSGQLSEPLMAIIASDYFIYRMNRPAGGEDHGGA